MKPSAPMLLSFLLPLTLAANAHAQEPSGATPQDMSPAAAAKAPDADLPAPESPLLERRSEGLRTAGIVLIPLGSTAIVGGMFVTVFAGMSGAHEEHGQGPSGPARVGLTFMGLGALALTTGIVMAVVGSKKVPVRTTEALGPAPRWTVQPLVGVGSAGVMGTF